VCLMLSKTLKIAITLLFFSVFSRAYAAVGDIEVPLKIRSNFIISDEIGPPENLRGLSKFAASLLIDFKVKKYHRLVTFSDDKKYIIFSDYYDNDALSYYQIISLTNYVNYRRDIAFKKSWIDDMKSRTTGDSRGDNSRGVEIQLPDITPPKWIGSIMGDGKSKIKVTGSRSITFSGRSQWEDGVVNTGTFKQSKFPALQMEQKSRFKVTGSIGSKITVEVDQDSDRHTDLANTIKLRYQGEEDEIIQSIEAGNTNLALPNSQFIGYSENVQGLFGIKGTAKVGNLDMTLITSQEKGSSEKASFNAGASDSDDKIRDYQYLEDTYFDITDRSQIGPRDSLITFELYTIGMQNVDAHGIAVVTPDPLDGSPNITQEEYDRTEFEDSYFKRMDPSEFTLVKPAWYVVLNNRLETNDALAAYYKFTRPVAGDTTLVDTITVGNLLYVPDPANPDSIVLSLKLLKYHNPDSSFTTWDMMWRNVYNLGVRNLSADGFELKIYKGFGGDGSEITDEESQGNDCYITLLGLDELNNNTNQPPPDCVFDFNTTMIDAAKGHLILPIKLPFDSPVLNEPVREIYKRTLAAREEFTKYYIWFKSSQRASTFSLGRANIIEGSDVVKLGDGTILKRGVDYTINYDIGQITFLTDVALNPAANVSVDFEFAPFFLPEKKTLLGFAAQYSMFERSSLSFAAMYRSETASEFRPRVGREPRKGFIWDANFAFNFKPEFMTDMIDLLPLIEADAASALNFSGEVAQSFPNPNTKNQAYIDDFEGTRTYTDLSTRRGVWTQCSPPVDTLYGTNSKADSLWWYNPFDPIRLTEIWPEREVRTQDDRTDVLFLNYFPGNDQSDPELTWSGIMRPLFSGLADQNLSKYIEFWYFPDTSATSAPELHLNLGAISEDINDDGLKNTEDVFNNIEDGVLRPEEDTGLDGVMDEDEPDYNSQTNPDPSHDNWHYDNSAPSDYSGINGTEGNANDPDRIGRPDTEDINRNTSLDTQNGYFEYVVDLNNPEYLAETTSTGWKLIRIPLKDPDAYEIKGSEASADFSRINFARLWLTGTAEPYLLKIATLQLVGNKWRELDIAYPEGDSLREEEAINVTVKNTHENLSYYPPPGVAGELDRETGLREKEQSLVFQYENLPPGHTGRAFWQLYQPENYTLYNKMQMYVHGDDNIADSAVQFFFRLGQDTLNFYEYRVVLEPGWSGNNEVTIDFTEISRIKYEMQLAWQDSLIEEQEIISGNYRVKGNPSFSQIKRFSLGVTIADVDTGSVPEQLYNGEVWIDELRVSEVRRNSDFAGRIQATAKFSDFADASFAFSRTGADFFPLSAQRPSGATTTNKSARFSIKANKLFPPSLGLNLPVSYTWQSLLQLPRLKPGSDIVLDDESREFEKTENRSTSYSINQSFNKNSNNVIWNLLLNRIKFNYTLSKTIGQSPVNPVSEQERYSGNASYDFSLRSKPSLKLFFWTKYLFMPNSLSESNFIYLPTKLNMKAKIDGLTNFSINQRDIVTSTRTKDLALNGSTGFAFFSSLRADYNIGSTRDISDPETFKLSVNPSKLKLGNEKSMNQRFDSSYQPKFIKFIDNRISFNSSYNENSDFKRNPDSTRTTTMQAAMRTELSLKFNELFSSRGGGGNRRGGGSPARPPRGGKGQEDDEDGKVEEEDQDENKKSKFSPGSLIRGIAKTFRSIKPIKGVYLKKRNLTRNGLLERPSEYYIFGFADDPHAAVKETIGPNTNQSILSDTYTLDSGIKLSKNIDISVGYNNVITRTRTTSDKIKATSVTFPDFSASIAGLENFLFFRSVARTVSSQFIYNEKIDERESEETGEKYNRSTTKRFAPLFGLNVTFNNNVKLNVRYDKSSGTDENLRGEGQSNRTTFNRENNIKIGTSYTLSAPQGLKIPLLSKIKFNSQLTLSLDITVRNTKTESVTNDIRNVDAHRKDLQIEPKFSYQFSKAITGGLRAKWNDTTDIIQDRNHHIRELGIWTEIRF